MRKFDRNISYTNATFQFQGIAGFIRLLLFSFDIRHALFILSNESKKPSGILCVDSRASYLREKASFLTKNSTSWSLLEVYPDMAKKNLSIRKIIFVLKNLMFYREPNIFLDKYVDQICMYKESLSSIRFIVFYEKSLLSMSVYWITDVFEVYQHGVPTWTYFPSLADIYHIWSEDFRQLFEFNYKGDLKVSGYIDCPYDFNVTGNWNLVFLSQLGSNDELKRQIFKVKQKVLEYSKDFKILVKLHPSETLSDWEILGDCTNLEFVKGNCRIVKSSESSLIFFSYYSTALIESLFLGFRVFRLIPFGSEVSDPFPSEIFKIPICTTDVSLFKFIMSLNEITVNIPVRLNLENL